MTAAPSSLELLHPDGFAGRVAVLGSGPGHRLVAPAGHGEEAVDLVLLAPTDTERRSVAWATDAARMASGLAEDGIVLAVGPSHRLAAGLAEVGLMREVELLHAPDVDRSRHLLPLRSAPARAALRELIAPGRIKSAALAAASLPGLGRLAPTSAVYRRPGSRPLLDWVGPLLSSGPGGVPSADSASGMPEALLTSAWRARGATTVRTVGGASAGAVVKVGAQAGREAEALRTMAAGAATEAVATPDLIGETEIGRHRAVAQTALAGRPAAVALAGSPAAIPALLRTVAGWLVDWNAATVVRRPFGADDAERLVLAPARAVAPRLDDDGGETWLAELERACTAVEGTEVPFVSAHNDLTAANLLLGADRVGVVDWEEAAPQCLPLGDFAYAAADFAAAVDGYADRKAAYATCFERDGELGAMTRELLGRAAKALGLEPPQAELCLHVCWLRHAADEQAREPEPGDGPAPFLAILRRHAQRRGRTA